MIREKTIRTVLPFVIVLLSTYFLADADLFENFGPRIDGIKHNLRLLWLLITGDALQALASFVISIILFKSWYKNIEKQFWFSSLMWQLAGAFFCWFIAAVISIVGTFSLFLWISGMFRFFSGIFMLYVANTVIGARALLYNPETRDESLLKAKKFDDLMKILNNEGMVDK